MFGIFLIFFRLILNLALNTSRRWIDDVRKENDSKYFKAARHNNDLILKIRI
jgi:hypothetical protein